MQWIKRTIDPQLIKSIASRWNLSDLLAVIFNRRAISDSEDELYYFSKHPIQEQHNPFSLLGIHTAIQRVVKAWKKKERLLIFGDRDVDGITATVALIKGLRSFDLECEWRVPVDNEQYGLSRVAVEDCAQEDISLIITVDCGISNHSEIELARQYGIDVIVLDHHNPPDELPQALAVINPKQADCKYPYPLISGCMLAYKFILAMQYYESLYGAFISDEEKKNSDSTIDTDVPNDLFQKFVAQKDLMANIRFYELSFLAAISTIADMMPLLNENRTIVDYGLRHIPDCANEGILALLRRKQIPANDVTARTLVFNTIPLLNAAGRFGKADLVVQLLLAEDARDADIVVSQLVEIHKQQKNLLQEAWHKHRTQAHKSYEVLRGHCVFICSDTITNTLTGLFANKLQQEFDTNAVVIAHNSEKITGSIRSVSECCATDLMRGFSSFFSNWGGHDRAAGFTILPGKYDPFVNNMYQHFQKMDRHEKPTRTIQIDAEIPRPLLTNDLFEINDGLEPFGQGFPPIVYYTQAVAISNIHLLGKDERHAKLLLHTGTIKIPAVFWNCRQYLGTVLRANNNIDIVYHVEYNYFRHNKEKRLSIIDAVLHGERHV